MAVPACATRPHGSDNLAQGTPDGPFHGTRRAWDRAPTKERGWYLNTITRSLSAAHGASAFAMFRIKAAGSDQAR